jgi:hypothetical protein
MREGTVRGYGLLGCMDFIDTLEPELRERAYANLAADVPRERSAVRAVGWYPHSDLTAYLMSIALVHGDEQKVEEALVGCGRCVAATATGTFMRLVMGLLTPAMFLKWMPHIWGRDMRIGRMESDVSQLARRRVRVRLTGVKDLCHFAPTARGFVEFVMNATGAKNVTVTMDGWSLTTPAPDTVRYDIQWGPRVVDWPFEPDKSAKRQRQSER